MKASRRLILGISLAIFIIFVLLLALLSTASQKRAQIESFCESIDITFTQTKAQSLAEEKGFKTYVLEAHGSSKSDAAKLLVWSSMPELLGIQSLFGEWYCDINFVAGEFTDDPPRRTYYLK